MKILLIDDEPACTELLQRLLVQTGLSTAIEVCNDPKEALKLLLKQPFDLVFLDIEMPFMNGFDLLDTLPEIKFHVIFTTAFDKYALKAIKFSALDYLLKPIDEEELSKSIAKFQKNEASASAHQYSALIDNVKHKRFNKIAITSSDGIEFVEVNDIIRCQSIGNYTKLFLGSKRVITSSKTLKEYELLLQEFGFARVHNSDLINLAHMRKYVKGDGGHVIMNDGSEVEVSRRRKDDFLSQI